MARIPIDREIKLIFLRWLKSGVESRELAELRHKYPTTKEEDADFRAYANNFLYEHGECALLKKIGKCYPDKTPDQHRSQDV